MRYGFTSLCHQHGIFVHFRMMLDVVLAAKSGAASKGANDARFFQNFILEYRLSKHTRAT